MAMLRRALPPIRASLSSIATSNPSIAANPMFGRFGLLRIQPQRVEYLLPIHVPRFNSMCNIQRKISRSFNITGRKLFERSFFGSAVAGLVYHNSAVVCAMDDQHADYGETSGILKDDVTKLWSILKKFHLPVILLLAVYLGWRRPIALVINVGSLLFCTRPSPSSIYIFLEQMRQREMHQHRRLFNAKLFLVKKVVVMDFLVLCVAKVELRDRKLNVIGILGAWWVLPNLQN